MTVEMGSIATQPLFCPLFTLELLSFRSLRSLQSVGGDRKRLSSRVLPQVAPEPLLRTIPRGSTVKYSSIYLDSYSKGSIVIMPRQFDQ